MNIRLQELWKKASIESDSWEAQQAFVEKFAELIVQECIDIISPYTVRMSRPGEEYLHPIQEIKQLFGTTK